MVNRIRSMAKSTIPELIEGLEIARREYAMEKKGEFVPRSSQ
jgi:sulfur carrier protein ThiS